VYSTADKNTERNNIYYNVDNNIKRVKTTKEDWTNHNPHKQIFFGNVGLLQSIHKTHNTCRKNNKKDYATID